MLKWLPFPFVRLTLVLAAGIYMGLRWEWPTHWLWCLWIAVILFFLILAGKLRGLSFQIYNPWLGLAALLAVFIAGLMRGNGASSIPQQGISRTPCYWARVLEPPLITPNYHRLLVTIQSYVLDGKALPGGNRMLCYLNPDTQFSLEFGDQLLITGSPSGIAPPANPYQFDYRRYLARQQVHWQHRVKDAQIEVYQPAGGTGFKGRIFVIRARLQGQIERYIPTGVASEIAGALLLGNREALSDPVEAAFADSGAMHILAVSGLHLGILYGALFYLIGHWRHRPFLKWLFLLFTLGMLWSFAIITGLATSTVRSAAMFSIMLMGKCRQRPGNSYNSLALSAAIILMVEPQQLFGVGFQLSYAALGSILYLQPKISGWYQPLKGFDKYIWDLLSVSLAAQLGVFPLSVYYFNQFPPYFLITNLLLVPLTFVILWSGMLFFIWGLWQPIAVYLGQILGFLTNMAYEITQAVTFLPGSPWKDIWITPAELVMVYLLMCSLIQYCLYLKKYYLQFTLGLWLIVVASSWMRFEIRKGMKQLVVYHLPGHQAMDFISGNRYFPVFSKGLTGEHREIKYNLAPYRGRQGLQPQAWSQPDYGTEAWQAWLFQEKLVILARSPFVLAGNYRIKAHVVIVSNNAVTDISKVISGMDIDLLIADGSNSSRTIERLKEQAQASSLAFHSLPDEGAKVINLSKTHEISRVPGIRTHRLYNH